MTISSDRRQEERPGSPSRRRTPRPPLWLNLLLLCLGLGTLVFAQEHRRRLDTRFAHIVQKQESSGVPIAKIRDELASMELTRDSLEHELQNRLAMARSFEAAEFYLAIDTTSHKLRLHYGPEIVRETDVVIGDPRVVTAGEKTWQFVALKGALTVAGKLENQAWEVPPWVYAMRSLPAPATPSLVPAGLGKYVILLPNGYVIHTPPPPDSPLVGAKPGSFMIAEDQMAAIWPRVSTTTRVYIY